MDGYIHSIESFGTVDGPGVRMVVFLQGCPMRCLYCHNPDTWEMSRGTRMSALDIIRQYERNQAFYAHGGLTVTGGEPLLQVDFLLELFRLAKERAIHTCIDTSGITFRSDDAACRGKLDRLLRLTDLVLLDIMLPLLSGIEVCRRVRMESQVPIIMLTAKDDVMDKVAGLDMGADDYMTKPFAIEELLARIRVTLSRHSGKRQAEAEKEELTFGALVLNTAAHSVSYNEEEITLTKKEYDLLECLLRNKNIAMSREQLLSQVWGYEYMGDTNVVDVYVRYLRQKIDDKYGIHMVETIRGIGYMIKED